MAFARGEDCEFQRKDYAGAAAAYRELASSADQTIRAGALLRLGRVLRKASEPDAALDAYPGGKPGSEKTDLVLHGEVAANAEPFAAVKHNITSRRKTAASVKWSPEPWSVGGERSEKQRTPDLSPLIQEVVDQPDWKKGNAVVLIISGSGRRNAECWWGGWSGVPMLYVEH